MERMGEIWRHWLGPMTFVLLCVTTAAMYPMALVLICVVLAGMFHRRLFGVIQECAGQLNDIFRGAPSPTGERVGGCIAGVRGVAGRVWAWRRGPF